MNFEGETATESWKGIVSIAAKGNNTAGLREDGTVVVIGDNKRGQCRTAGWKDIVAIELGYECTLGLKADGTLVTAGNTSWQSISSKPLFGSLDTIEQERSEARGRVKARCAALNDEKTKLQTELANLKGLFTGKRRKEIEARLAEIESELSKLQ